MQNRYAPDRYYRATRALECTMREPHEEINAAVRRLETARQEVDKTKKAGPDAGENAIVVLFLVGVGLLIAAIWLGRTFGVMGLGLIAFSIFLGIVIQSTSAGSQAAANVNAIEAELQRLLTAHKNDVEIRRECKRCEKVWYVQPAQVKSFEQKAVLSTLVGLTSGEYAQTLRNQNALSAELRAAEQCPECASRSFVQKYDKI